MKNKTIVITVIKDATTPGYSNVSIDHGSFDFFQTIGVLEAAKLKVFENIQPKLDDTENEK